MKRRISATGLVSVRASGLVVLGFYMALFGVTLAMLLARTVERVLIVPEPGYNVSLVEHFFDYYLLIFLDLGYLSALMFIGLWIGIQLIEKLRRWSPKPAPAPPIPE